MDIVCRATNRMLVGLPLCESSLVVTWIIIEYLMQKVVTQII